MHLHVIQTDMQTVIKMTTPNKYVMTTKLDDNGASCVTFQNTELAHRVTYVPSRVQCTVLPVMLALLHASNWIKFRLCDFLDSFIVIGVQKNHYIPDFSKIGPA